MAATTQDDGQQVCMLWSCVVPITGGRKQIAELSSGPHNKLLVFVYISKFGSSRSSNGWSCLSLVAGLLMGGRVHL